MFYSWITMLVFFWIESINGGASQRLWYRMREKTRYDANNIGRNINIFLYGLFMALSAPEILSFYGLKRPVHLLKPFD